MRWSNTLDEELETEGVVLQSMKVDDSSAVGC